MPRTIKDDIALVANIQIGDRGAQRHFVQIHESFIRGVISRLGSDTNQYMDDLCQGVYEYLARDNYHVLGAWQKTAQLKSYLYTIVRRHALKLLKEHKGLNPGSDKSIMDIQDEGPTPEENQHMNERKECIARAMQGITESYRYIIDLKHYKDLTYKEIGLRLDITISNVGVRLSRAEKKFITLFEEICPDHYLDLFGQPNR